jgi:hypothetical protein
VSQLAPYAASNKLAREEAKNLENDAQKQAGLVELENTLKNSDLSRKKTNVDIEKSGLDVKDGKLKLEQQQRLSDAMKKLGALDSKTDPSGDQRRALQENILTMLGKEAKDDYIIQEVGGGTDPITNLPLPKRAVVFDKRTGKVVSDVGGGAPNQAGSGADATSQFKQGALYNVGGKVVKVVGFNKDGTPQLDDDV